MYPKLNYFRKVTQFVSLEAVANDSVTGLRFAIKSLQADYLPTLDLVD